MDDLQGKVAFVTGAASGIGFGIARACAEVGMRVVLADMDTERLARAADALRTVGAEVMPFPLNVTDRDGWARAAREVPVAMGPVQLLVNNAGVSTFGMPFAEIDPELWDRVVNINLTGVFNGVHYFFDGMREAGVGHIVNTASHSGLRGGLAKLAPYIATKFGVVGLSEALRTELGDLGIGVSVLCPGTVRTQLWRTSKVFRGLPDADTPPAVTAGTSADPNAKDPYEVGRRMLDGVLSNDLYIFTNVEARSSIEDRHQRILAGIDRVEAFAI